VILDNEIKDAFENLARLKGSKIKKIDSIMLHAVLVLYMCAGLKKKEITEVKIKDVIFTHGRIWIHIFTMIGGQSPGGRIQRHPIKDVAGHVGAKGDRRETEGAKQMDPPYPAPIKTHQKWGDLMGFKVPCRH